MDTHTDILYLNSATNSDYQYLSEHFRDSHYLCEEGRCATEQFTHAFRTEIDYKAHKTAEHSKNRAEARQNRQIDLQFNYAPRQQRRNEGCYERESLLYRKILILFEEFHDVFLTLKVVCIVKIITDLSGFSLYGKAQTNL